MSAKPDAAVYGHRLTGPRLTPMAVWLAFRWVGLPILGVTFILDVIVYVIARAAFDRCVGLWCATPWF